MEICTLVLGFFSWFITGVDDILIFSWVWERANCKSEKQLAIVGFLFGILCMIAITILFSEIVSYMKYTNIILGVFLVYLGFNTSLNRSETIKINPKKIYLLSFFGYILNCSDDIVWNGSMIAGKNLNENLLYFSGLMIASLLTILIIKYWSKTIKSYSKLRGLTMVFIGVAILFNLF